MNRPNANDLVKNPPLAATSTPDSDAGGRSPVENCARIRHLGYRASKHIQMYGERFELVSDPFEKGDCTVVQVISENDPTIRLIQLPVSILLGLSDRSGQKTKFGKRLP